MKIFLNLPENNEFFELLKEHPNAFLTKNGDEVIILFSRINKEE